MRCRSMLWLFVMVVTVACEPQPTGPPPVTRLRPLCPFDDSVVMFGGDSLVTQWPRFVQLPTDLVPYNTASGGSAFTGNLSPIHTTGTIGGRILDELDECGNEIGAVVIGGGHVDLSYGTSAADVIASIDELDADLHARGVRAVFLAITPVSNATDWHTAHQATRREVNAWMETPGNLHGDVVDCARVLESSPGSDVLANRFWNFIDPFGTIDLVHPNDAAYAAIGACIQPAILAAVER